MNTKDLARYDRSDREGIEHVDKRLPSLDIGPSFTFVVEPVDYDSGERHETERQDDNPRIDLLWAERLVVDSPRVTFAHS